MEFLNNSLIHLILNWMDGLNKLMKILMIMMKYFRTAQENINQG